MPVHALPPEFPALAQAITGHWPAPAAWPALLAQARSAQLEALLALRCPAALRGELLPAYRQAAARHLYRLHAWQTLRDWFGHQGLEPLVLKGAALACTHYPDPAARPHSDMDLLLPATSRPQVEAGLRKLGYQYHLSLGDTPISTQCTYLQAGQAYDLHWSISNSPYVSAQVGSYAALRQRAVWVPQLGAHALAAPDALTHACLHWAQHQRYGEQRLIWLYDLILLLNQLSEAETALWRERLHRQRLSTLIKAALRQAVSLFPTSLSAGWPTWLEAPCPPEPSLALLEGSRWQQLYLDWQALSGLKARITWLKAYLIPSWRYMQTRHPDIPPRWLWLQYLRRLLPH